MLEKLLKRLPWKPGRQGTGYSVFTFLQSERFLCDGHILYYPEGSEIPPHRDKVLFGKHYRLNIMFKKAKAGGEFICENPIFKWWRISLFRPDASTHSVTKIVDGYRVMLSIGWVRGK